jgi:hypothetical protein
MTTQPENRMQLHAAQSTKLKASYLNARSYGFLQVLQMNAADARRQLDEIADAGDDFEWRSGQLTAKCKSDPKGFEAVEASY